MKISCDTWAQDSKRHKKVHLKHGEKTNNSNGQSNNNNKITVNKNRTTNQQQEQKSSLTDPEEQKPTKTVWLITTVKHIDINRH